LALFGGNTDKVLEFMKILFLLTQDLDSPYGIGRCFPLARELVILGHEVTIAALHSDFLSLENKRFTKDGVKVIYVSQMHVLKRENIKIHLSPLKLLLYSARGTLALCAIAFSEKADIIHICKPHPMNSIAGLLATSIHGNKLFLDYDDYEAASSHFSGSWQKRIVVYFEDTVPQRCDFITTHNSFLEERLKSLDIPDKKIIYLPNGVDKKRFSINIKEEDISKLQSKLGLSGKKIIAFIGSLSTPSHPINLLLEAFKIVHEQNADTLLLLVGGGDAYDQTVDQVSQMGLENSVCFTGKIPSDDIPLYYQLAHVVVDPVYNDDIARGRLPLKLFESWISGIPFVSGDVGDRRKILGNPPAGLLTRPGDAIDLAEKIIDIITNDNISMELSSIGIMRARKYEWSSLVEEFEYIYQ
jgi:glycosyltransferase involved in cell wall biosynthesis